MAAQAFNTFATKPNAKRQQGRGEERVGEGEADVQEEDVEGEGQQFWFQLEFRLSLDAFLPCLMPHSYFECRRVFGIDYVSCSHTCPTLCSSASSPPPPSSRKVICTCFDVNEQNFIKKNSFNNVSNCGANLT